MPQFLIESTTNAVHTITLARPKLHNAFNEVVIEGLTNAFVEAGKRDDVRVLILAAEGKSFCAGADIHWMKRMVEYAFEENVADDNAMADMLRASRGLQAARTLRSIPNSNPEKTATRTTKTLWHGQTSLPMPPVLLRVANRRAS